MIRFGLCCVFHEVPIKFRTTTVTYALKLKKSGEDYLAYLSNIVEANLTSLEEAIKYCEAHGIGCFRVLSQIFPVYTHPDVGYTIDDLPNADEIWRKLKACKQLAQKLGVRLALHPDQFVVLSSPSEKVVEASISELEYHGLLADHLGVDVINIHGGGIYGDKVQALERFVQNFSKLSVAVRSRLTLENDDKCYSPEDLLPICQKLQIPLVYDVHHHRCLKDKYTIEEASRLAYATWNREPLFHISSPAEGWEGKNPKIHHDYIDPEDFPAIWFELGPLTVEIEAKAKEVAIARLRSDLE